MIRTSPQTEQLDEAFARAQGKFEAAIKSSNLQKSLSCLGIFEGAVSFIPPKIFQFSVKLLLPL